MLELELGAIAHRRQPKLDVVDVVSRKALVPPRHAQPLRRLTALDHARHRVRRSDLEPEGCALAQVAADAAEPKSEPLAVGPGAPNGVDGRLEPALQHGGARFRPAANPALCGC